jgi:hypothetical protein
MNEFGTDRLVPPTVREFLGSTVCSFSHSEVPRRHLSDPFPVEVPDNALWLAILRLKEKPLPVSIKSQMSRPAMLAEYQIEKFYCPSLASVITQKRP